MRIDQKRRNGRWAARFQFGNEAMDAAHMQYYNKNAAQDNDVQLLNNDCASRKSMLSLLA